MFIIDDIIVKSRTFKKKKDNCLHIYVCEQIKKKFQDLKQFQGIRNLKVTY